MDKNWGVQNTQFSSFSTLILDHLPVHCVLGALPLSHWLQSLAVVQAEQPGIATAHAEGIGTLMNQLILTQGVINFSNNENISV